MNRLQSPITQLALMRFRSEDIKIRKWKRKLETWATRHWLPNFGEKTRKSNYLLGRLIVSRWMDKLSSTIQIVRSKPKCNISCTRLFPYYLANLQPVSQHLKWKFVFSGSIWLSWKRHWKGQHTSNGRIKTNNPILRGIYAWRGAGSSPKLYGQTAFRKRS